MADRARDVLLVFLISSRPARMNSNRSSHRPCPLLCACVLFALACSNEQQVPAVAESAIAVEVGTLTPPGDALYWNGICGAFTVQPGYYSPGDHFFAVGAPTVAVETEADARDEGSRSPSLAIPGFRRGRRHPRDDPGARPRLRRLHDRGFERGDHQFTAERERFVRRHLSRLALPGRRGGPARRPRPDAARPGIRRRRSEQQRAARQ